MFEPLHAFGGFSVRDIPEAQAFYGDVLGLTVEQNEMGALDLTLPGGARIFVYQKPDHTPASFTILNFVVDDIDVAVDSLNERGVSTTIYDDPMLPTDDKGIMRGKRAGRGPDIAWFRDPAGNVLSVLTS